MATMISEAGKDPTAVFANKREQSGADIVRMHSEFGK